MGRSHDGNDREREIRTTARDRRGRGNIISVRGIGKAYPRVGGAPRARCCATSTLPLRLALSWACSAQTARARPPSSRSCAGLLRPDSGDGTVLGYNLLRQHAQVRARVSLVAPTADVGIDNNLTVRQNLTFWAPIYGLHGARARARIDELLGKLGLEAKADFWPMHISAGQRQRLALARSLLAENRLVFLDEPTNKLDLEGVRSVRQMISELNREQGATIVLTTHVMEEAEELCGEIALLRQGELIAHQPTGDSDPVAPPGAAHHASSCAPVESRAERPGGCGHSPRLGARALASCQARPGAASEPAPPLRAVTST